MTSQLAVRETAPVADLTVRRLRRLLLDERRAQLERAAALVHHDEADAVPAADPELVDVLAAQARQTVDEIDAALARIDADTYGRCEACGEGLQIARLEAIPHARSCVACQT
jgi:RNA polymerase-binding transcription factor DksA